MTRISLLVAAIFLVAATEVFAEYGVWDKGVWPETWPKELEALRPQAKTYEGPRRLTRLYLIPFTKREEFEAAWPHLLKVKTKGAPIFLVRGPRTDFFALQPAGVMVVTPPVAEKPDGTAERIELVVDGEIVDLNRIELPADTPIVDERFKEKK